MLFIIDEFAFWQDKHPEGSPQYADDENILETLAFVLPRDLDLEIYTVIASQKPAPAKLRGDRFKDILLLAGKNEKDYDIIASKRVREIVPAKMPELEQYYNYYYSQFKLYKTIGKEYFVSVFPFQPRCFEVLRRITQRELPTERSGINVAYETINNKDVLNRSVLIILSDLLFSSHLVDCLNTSLYQDCFKAHQTAVDVLSTFELDNDERDVAKRIIDTIFLIHVAYLETPKPLSIQDLTEATLTIGDVIKNEDMVEVVLNKIRDLPQLEYSKDKGVRFVVKKDGEIKPVQIFANKKRRITEVIQIQKGWEDGLILPAELTDEKSLFSGSSFESFVKLSAAFRNMEYPGEYIVARTWKNEYGEQLGEGIHFRIVFLTRNEAVAAEKIQDSRVVVCIPSELSNGAKEASRDYVALKEMEEEYSSHDKVGPEAEEIRSWLKEKRKEIIRALISKQLVTYKSGVITSKQQVALDEKKVFLTDKIDKIIEECAAPLLLDTYSFLPIDASSLKRRFSPRDASKVFEGLFKQNPAQNALSACDNFAVAFHLSRRDDPRKFKPENNDVITILAKELEETKGELHIWKIYNTLQSPPYGLLKELITLMLLSFVRLGNPLVEIVLKPGHRLSLKSNKINSFNVPSVEWRSGIEEEFDTLQMSTGVSWDKTVTFGRIIESNLKSATFPEDVANQESKLLMACKEIKGNISSINQNITLLASKLLEDLPKEGLESINKLEKVVSAENFTLFFETIEECFDGNEQLFKRAKDIFDKYNLVAKDGAALLSIISYVSALVIPEANKLHFDKVALKTQLKLTRFLDNPSLAGVLKENFEKFKAIYQNQYQVFHRDHYKNVGDLNEKMEIAAAKIKAITNLDSIKELGLPESGFPQKQYEEILQKLKTCQAQDPVSVEEVPYCNSCRIALGVELPTEEVVNFVKSVDKTLDLKAKMLFQALSKEILSQDKDNKLNALIKVIQVAKLDQFVSLLTPELSNYIRDILNRANVKYETFNILKEISEKFAYIDEDNLDEVIKMVKEKLASHIEDMKKKNKGKKVRINLR